jgi:hypothetical protein
MSEFRGEERQEEKSRRKEQEERQPEMIFVEPRHIPRSRQEKSQQKYTEEVKRQFLSEKTKIRGKPPCETHRRSITKNLTQIQT